MASILLVDDNELIRVLLSATLAENGFRPVAVASGARALALVAAERFDLVIVDSVMPGMNGAEVVHHLRHHPEPAVRVMPIVGLSGADPDFREKFLAAGADACLAKPVKDEPLLATVTSLVGEQERTQSSTLVSSAAK